MKDKLIALLKESPNLNFMKIYDGFQFKTISFPIIQPIMVVSYNNISSVNEVKDFVTTNSPITLTIYSPEKSYNLHISDISKKVCEVLSNLKYSFNYNGYSHNPIGYLESKIIVNDISENFITKNDISVFINNDELPFIKNISIESQRQEHYIQTIDNNKPFKIIPYNEHYNIIIDFMSITNNNIVDTVANLKDFSMTINYNNTIYTFNSCNWTEKTENIDDKNRLIKKLVISTYDKE